MAVDGYLTFNTKIDTEGFDKGTKTVSSKVLDLKNKISSTEAQIKSLKSELEKTSNVRVNPKIAEDIEKSITEAEAKLKQSNKRMASIRQDSRITVESIGGGDRLLDRMLAKDSDYQQAKKSAEEYKATIIQLRNELNRVNASAPLTKDTAEYQKKKQRLNELSGQLNAYKAKLSEAEQAEEQEAAAARTSGANHATARQKLERTISALKMLANGAAKAGRALKTAFSKSVGKLISNISNHFRKANNSTNVLEKSLRRIKNTLIRMFFFRLVHSPIDAIKDGLGEIAKISPVVNKNLSALKTESTYLKNSFAALAAPLVNLLTPAFAGLMNTMAGVLNQTGQFISVFTGQSGFTQAIRVQQDYAESLDDSTKSTKENTKAAKENQKVLAGFDELNILNIQDEDESNTTSSSPIMFENMADQTAGLSKTLLDALKSQDFEAVGAMFGEKINAALSKIKWGKIKTTAKKIAGNIAGFLNGFLESADWNLVGSTIGEGINTAVTFTQTFLTRFKWNKLGKSVATLINKTFSTIEWEKVGLTISNGINAFFSTANGFFSTLNWTSMGLSLRAALVTALENINWEEIKSALVNGINGLIDLAVAFIGEPDFGDLGEKTAEGLKNVIRRINWDGIKEVFSKLFIGSLDFVDGFVLKIDWKELGNKLSKDFSDFFGEGGDGRKAITISGKTIGDVCRSTMDLVNGFFEDKETADSFSGAVEEFFKSIPWVELIVKSITGGIELGTWIVQAATKLVNDFCKALADGFSGAADDPELAKAMTGLGKALVNLFIGVLNSLISTIVTAIPNIFIGLIKAILGALAWVLQPLLGEDFYKENEKNLNNWKGIDPNDIPKIPYLATGAFIPANYGEFLAVLGDNKREAEVVSPVSAMKQAFLEALAEMGPNTDSGTTEINLHVDGDKLFSWLVSKNNQYKKSHGYSALEGAEI